MKEGYFQNKISEFSQIIQDFEHRMKFAETVFERFQIELGSFKQLLKKLKHIEDFQNQLTEKIKLENEKYIEQNIKELIREATKMVDKVIEKKTTLISESMKQIEKDEKQFKLSLQQIQTFQKEILFYNEFQHLLMLKLINKGILDNRELKELELRAKKRVMKNK